MSINHFGRPPIIHWWYRVATFPSSRYPSFWLECLQKCLPWIPSDSRDLASFLCLPLIFFFLFSFVSFFFVIALHDGQSRSVASMFDSFLIRGSWWFSSSRLLHYFKTFCLPMLFQQFFISRHDILNLILKYLLIFI